MGVDCRGRVGISICRINSRLGRNLTAHHALADKVRVARVAIQALAARLAATVVTTLLASAVRKAEQSRVGLGIWRVLRVRGVGLGFGGSSGDIIVNFRVRSRWCVRAESSLFLC